MASRRRVTLWVSFSAFALVVFSSTSLPPTIILDSVRGEDENSPNGAGVIHVDDEVGMKPFGVSAISAMHSASSDETSPAEKAALQTVNRFNLAASNRVLAENWTTLVCGSNHLCRNAQKPRDGQCDFNCHSCQCDDMCHFYGDCCPDLLFGDSPHIPSVPSPSVSCSREYWTKWGNMSDIFMVSLCPINAEPNTVEKCERPINKAEIQATPVSVVNTNITYRNIFCAHCHNESNVRAWQHRVSCTASTEEMSTAKTRAELWRLIVRNSKCAIQTLPPNGVVPRQCFHENVTRCRENVTETILDLCTSFSNPVIFNHSNTNSTTYRNVFCAACNGIILERGKSCSRSGESVRGPPIPGPLSVLLNFNSEYEKDISSFAGHTRQDACGKTRFYDPFSMTCRDIKCSRRRIFTGAICEDVFASGSGAGYSLDIIVKSKTSAQIQPSDLRNQYLGQLKEYLESYKPLLISMINVTKLQDDENLALGKPLQLARVQANVVTASNKSRTDFENTLLDFTTEDFPYHFRKKIVTMTSDPNLCLEERVLPSSYKYLSSSELATDPTTVFPNCLSCLDNISFEPIQLNCPFIEYTNSFQENFMFDPLSSTLNVGEHSFSLVAHEFRSCSKTLMICIDTIANISETLFLNQTENLNENKDFVLSIVSLVCISLSLVGLLLTFLVYCLLPKLRTLPGKNSMVLMFHLFCSHLLFLTTSNRTTNVVLCQVFGVLLHYFWMASFTWMLISAYHMYTVFTRIRAFVRIGNGDTKRVAAYSMFGILLPVFIISSCIITHVLKSDGSLIGYGGSVCFLNSPVSLGVFFVGPLALILFANAAFFAKTILAIQSVPDMERSSNKTRKHHVIVYIRLSLLFGFTWIFGICDVLFPSIVLKYAFNILTGSQGLLIFVAYCVNRRTWEDLKSELVGGEESSISGSRIPDTASTDRTPEKTAPDKPQRA